MATDAADIQKRERAARRGPFARLRIRKKLMVLHTLFSIVLAVIVLLAIRPTLGRAIAASEHARGRQALGLPQVGEAAAETVEFLHGEQVEQRFAQPVLEAARAKPGTGIETAAPGGASAIVIDDPGLGLRAAIVTSGKVRSEIARLYVVLAISLALIYAFVVVVLELLILPRHVYGPIDTLRDADRALQEGREEQSLIPERQIPADELGDVMRLRNESVLTLRRNERQLAEALAKVEQAATDLRRKNHLLETAKRNLEGADRLASLGMMSAGIAHEINTPLAVIKGTLQQAEGRGDGRLSDAESALLLRVTERLERLGESLLDFARTRQPEMRETNMRALVEEAFTLVRIDRDTAGIELSNAVDGSFTAWCDPDRMLQVLVNLVRNAADALGETAPSDSAHDGSAPSIEVSAEMSTREGEPQVALVITDTGPGIEPELLPTLFEPFVSTRLDSKGTGLGLAVAEGIVAEHGGVVLAGNRPRGPGARFEILWPSRPASTEGGKARGASGHDG